MGLPKGRTNNTKGRTPDAKVKEFREGLRDRLIERLDDLFAKIDLLQAKDYVDAYVRIVKDVLPPLVSELNEEEITKSVISVFETIHHTLQDDINKKNTGSKKTISMKAS